MKNKKPEKSNKNLKVKKTNDKYDENSEDIVVEDYDPKKDPKLIISFDYYLDMVNDLKKVDLVFLLDTTASMNCYSKDINKIILKIISDLEKNLSKFFIEDLDILNVGLVTYRDHEDEEKTYLINIDLNLTNNFSDIKNLIYNISYEGGKDEPEAVVDGLNAIVNEINWRDNSTKFLVHILDAPGHGKKLNNLEGDKIENCPKNLNYEEILDKIRKKGIIYHIIEINDSIDIMIKEFEKIIDIEIIKPEINMDKTKILKQD